MQYVTVEQILQDLNNTFKPTDYKPNTHHIEDIMYREGQQSVVRYLINKYNKGTNNGQFG